MASIVDTISSIIKGPFASIRPAPAPPPPPRPAGPPQPAHAPLPVTPHAAPSFALKLPAIAAPIKAANALAVPLIGGGRTISTSITGPVVLASTDNPLTITSTGTVTSTGTADGVDGGAGTTWTIGNSGKVTSAGAYGIRLSGAGVVTNSGSISGNDALGLSAGGSVHRFGVYHKTKGTEW